MNEIVKKLRFGGEGPVLSWLPEGFQSAVFLLPPFIQMPSNWDINMYNHLPTRTGRWDRINEDMLQYGQRLSWKQVMKDSEIHSEKELLLALLSSGGMLHPTMRRLDLLEKMQANLKDNCYPPDEDIISISLLPDVINLLRSKGTKRLYHVDPISEEDGFLDAETVTPKQIWNLTRGELFIMDEEMNFVVGSMFDSFTPMLYTKEANIEPCIRVMNVEAVICDEHTTIDWFR
ncbi:DUF2711 family protein [Priestia taiwanensis]|uniref:Uncharacterized protein n=1 Tax=Priestia taiwanensis TaxID=1347902 RepID=A0A917AT31_9BACI|nr:DUF2711 family protein [Priestia taiwanensis]MBM7364162.1 hypothetical protein [Priestia taiwanensis]GGE72121.1 hypothetical protein GCM10007140_22580 [Priestia taiwanensis]